MTAAKHEVSSLKLKGDRGRKEAVWPRIRTLFEEVSISFSSPHQEKKFRDSELHTRIFYRTVGAVQVPRKTSHGNNLLILAS